MKKLFILTAIITGFSFISVDGNCMSNIKSTQGIQQNKDLNISVDGIDEVPDYGEYVINNEELIAMEEFAKDYNEKRQIQIKLNNIKQEYKNNIDELKEEYGDINLNDIKRVFKYIGEEQEIIQKRNEQLNYLKTNLQQIKEEYDNNIDELKEKYGDINPNDIKRVFKYIGEEQAIMRKRDAQFNELVGYYGNIIFED